MRKSTVCEYSTQKKLFVFDCCYDIWAISHVFERKTWNKSDHLASVCLYFNTKHLILTNREGYGAWPRNQSEIEKKFRMSEHYNSLNTPKTFLKNVFSSCIFKFSAVDFSAPRKYWKLMLRPLATLARANIQDGVLNAFQSPLSFVSERLFVT